MTDANLIRLMTRSSRKSGLVLLETVREGVEAVKARMDELAAQGTPWLRLRRAVRRGSRGAIGAGSRRARACHGRQRRGPRVRYTLHRRDGPAPPAPRQRAASRLCSPEAVRRRRRRRWRGSRGSAPASPSIRWPCRGSRRVRRRGRRLACRHTPGRAVHRLPTASRTGSPRRPVSAGSRWSHDRAGARRHPAALVETGVRRILVAGAKLWRGRVLPLRARAAHRRNHRARRAVDGNAA